MAPWLEIIAKLGLLGALAFAVFVLWNENRSMTKEIARLNEARIADLKAILKQHD